jgi:hypothetical protein
MHALNTAINITANDEYGYWLKDLYNDLKK